MHYRSIDFRGDYRGMSGTLCTKSYGLIRFSAGKPSLPPLRARYPTLYSKFSCTNSAKDNWHPLHRLNALRHFHNSTLHTISPCNAQECWQTKVNLRTPRAAFRRPMGSNLISTRLFSTPATEGETADLVKWIEAGGGRCESMRIATDSVNGQTLVADRRIREGKQVVLLPPSRQLKAYSAEPGLQRLIDLVPLDLWAARLALPILVERTKGIGSHFWPYLQSLPLGVAGLPLFYCPEEVAALQYPPLIQQVKLRCRWLLDFSKERLTPQASTQLFNGITVDVNLLGWGMAVASSRAFKVGKSKQPCMLPLIDLCNHSFTPNCRMETSADGTLRLIAAVDIAADEAITITYGTLSNTSLLQDYGFIVDDNPNDKVDMLVSVDTIQVAQVLAGVGIPDKPQQWQREMLERLGAHGNGCSVNLAKREPMFDWRLVAAVRVLCAENEAEFEGVDLQRLGDLNAPLPDKLEGKALKTLAAMCAQLISAMGNATHPACKSEDDRRLLQQGGLSQNMQLAVRYRLQLKLFIQAALALVLNKLKQLPPTK